MSRLLGAEAGNVQIVLGFIYAMTANDDGSWTDAERLALIRCALEEFDECAAAAGGER